MGVVGRAGGWGDGGPVGGKSETGGMRMGAAERFRQTD